MAFNSNLGHWLRGSTKADELRATRAQWERVQAAWRASPIAAASETDPIGALALEINRESWEALAHTPTVPIAVEVGEATCGVLSAEAIGDISPVWEAIEGDLSVAVEFRDALARRFRYSTDFLHVHGVL